MWYESMIDNSIKFLSEQTAVELKYVSEFRDYHVHRENISIGLHSLAAYDVYVTISCDNSASNMISLHSRVTIGKHGQG